MDQDPKLSAAVHREHVSLSHTLILRCLFFHPVFNFRSFSNVFECDEVAVSHSTPNLKYQGISFFWVITFDLSGMRGPTSSYATISIALMII
jgi:hypothetical protein